jgi:hypothetical protein
MYSKNSKKQESLGRVLKVRLKGMVKYLNFMINIIRNTWRVWVGKWQYLIYGLRILWVFGGE